MTDKSAAGLKVDPELIAYWKAAPKHSNEYLAAELLESTLRELADCRGQLAVAQQIIHEQRERLVESRLASPTPAASDGLAEEPQQMWSMPDVKLTTEWVESERRHWLDEAAGNILPHGFLLRAALCDEWLRSRPAQGRIAAPCRHEWYQGECVHCTQDAREFFQSLKSDAAMSQQEGK